MDELLSEMLQYILSPDQYAAADQAAQTLTQQLQANNSLIPFTVSRLQVRHVCPLACVCAAMCELCVASLVSPLPLPTVALCADCKCALALPDGLQRLFRAEKQLPQRVWVMPFPISPFSSNAFYTTTSTVFAFIFSFSFLFPASRLLRGIVYEKEAKIREGMRTMGLGHGALLTSWYLTYAILVLIQSILITLVTSNTIFKSSEKPIIFVLFFLFGLSTMSLCMLVRGAAVWPSMGLACRHAVGVHLCLLCHTCKVCRYCQCLNRPAPVRVCCHCLQAQLTVFFSKSKTAVVIGLVILFCSVFPIIAVGSDSTSESSKVAVAVGFCVTCLSPPSCPCWMPGAVVTDGVVDPAVHGLRACPQPHRQL